jgi:hypothetical protein
MAARPEVNTAPRCPFIRTPAFEDQSSLLTLAKREGAPFCRFLDGAGARSYRAFVPSRSEKLPASPNKAKPPVGKFDKAFPVFLEGDRGVAAGVGRNITDSGMFVETREPFPLGTRVRVTFTSPHGGAEMTLEGEVRYQCFINFARADSTRSGMRGVGLRFVPPQQTQKGPRGTVH